MTPLDKLRDLQDELLQLWQMGAIDKGTFERASQAAIKEYEDALDTLDEKANIKLRMDATAIREGSVEYDQMLRGLGSFEAKFNASTNEKEDKTDEMEAHLRRLVEIEEDRMYNARMHDIGMADLA